jgi:hypothetical protein
MCWDILEQLVDDQLDSGAKRCGALLEELLSRRDLDQAARSEFAGDDREAVERLIQIDDDNAAWLRKVVDTVGWPGRSLVGDEGAHAAWLLAQTLDWPHEKRGSMGDSERGLGTMTKEIYPVLTNIPRALETMRLAPAFPFLGSAGRTASGGVCGDSRRFGTPPLVHCRDAPPDIA